MRWGAGRTALNKTLVTLGIVGRDPLVWSIGPIGRCGVQNPVPERAKHPLDLTLREAGFLFMG